MRSLYGVTVLGIVGVSAAMGAWAAAEKPVDYTREIKPILALHCYSCHGATKQEGRLRLDTGGFARKGGLSGPAANPGHPEASALLRRVTADAPPLRMPPDTSALKPEQIEWLRRWIAEGAVSPKEEKPETDPRRHWAFLVVKRPEIRNCKLQIANFKMQNPIDSLVAAEWEKRGLMPSPPADRATLLRRVTLDLTGVPPTRAELHAFLADRTPGAYEKVVDRLLASPKYGERWGRHWMDVWRYSDWYGRRGVNDVRNSYGQIWRWRDWIVRSLNEDKGYDRMVQEMLAADELCPEDDQNIVATGFIVRNWYSLNYNQWMRDQVEHTGKAFLGLTLNCAHCHSHKYDPISQREYFQFRAFFEPLEMRHDRVPGEPDPGPFVKYIYASSTAPLKTGMIRIFDEHPEAQTRMYALGDERNQLPKEAPCVPAPPAILGGWSQSAVQPVTLPGAAYYPGAKAFIREEELAKRKKALTAQQVSLAGCAGDPAKEAVVRAAIAAAEAEMASFEARMAADDARFLGKGDGKATAVAASKAERVAALKAAAAELAAADLNIKMAGMAALGRLQAAEKALAAAKAKAEGDNELYTSLSPSYPKTSSGRRLALARWITNPKNPLTARVAVNHIWMRHFGKPIVPSVFDFGRNGKAPTNQALLDWLASELTGAESPKSKVQSPKLRLKHELESGGGPESGATQPMRTWRMKRLHRLIVTSAAYRMSSGLDGLGGMNVARDPDNIYLWRFPARRLESEAVRDSLLSVSNSLDATMGGPELDNQVEDPSKPTGRRRSLYYSVYAEDGGAMRLLSTFDAPDTCDAYKRGESIVPQQALALANSPVALAQSRVLAKQLWAEVGADRLSGSERDSALINAAFEAVLSRKPTRDEGRECRSFLRLQAVQPALSQAMSGDERALSTLIHALFNHNDFVTMR